MKTRILFVIILCACSLGVQAQRKAKRDTLKSIPEDTLRLDQGNIVVPIETYAARFNPRKAILFAAVVPGLGQIYNRKYWKVPLVLGGFALEIYSITFFNDQYTMFKSDLFDLLRDGTSVSPTGLNEQQLRNLVDRAKRQRDYFTIITGFWYILQLVDAHVDAHLKEFDLNPQLKVKLEPMLESNPYTGRSAGVTLKFMF